MWSNSLDGTTLPCPHSALSNGPCSRPLSFLWADDKPFPLLGGVPCLVLAFSQVSQEVPLTERSFQLFNFLTSRAFPFQPLLQTAMTIYVASCGCLMSFLLISPLTPWRKGCGSFVQHYLPRTQNSACEFHKHVLHHQTLLKTE